MGLGKTATVLQALTPDHLPALVLAPKRVAEEVWSVEGAKWRPDLTVARAVGDPRRRAEMRALSADVTVMTRDTIADLGSRKHPYRTVILDESSGYKTKSTERWKATRRVTTQADHVWALTGTPAPNGYMDLWAQVFLLDKGKRLEPTLTAFRDRYFTATKRHRVTHAVIEWTLKPGAAAAIERRIDDLCLSMKAEDYLELPEFTINEVHFQMPPSVRKVYDDLQDNLVADLGLLGQFTAGDAAQVSARLRQVVSGFLYADQDPTRWAWLHDERIRTVKEIVEGCGNSLVFYQFKAEKEALLKALKEFDVRTIDSPNVVSDWNAGRVRTLLAHPQAAGHGLNLQHGGHNVVWSSLTWSLEEWMQGNGRLHRQGQANNVVVHVPLIPGTVDRTVLTALRNKTSVQDALLTFLSENERMLR
jgi:SNF2 family DNA or RNA helicase